MIYLTKEDVEVVVKAALLDQILAGDESQLTKLEKRVMDTVRGYLNPLYDMANEFGKTGDERNGVLIGHMVSMIRYKLYQLLPKGGYGTPSDVSSDYRDAMDWLKEVGAGKVNCEIAKRLGEDQEPKTSFKAHIHTVQNWHG